MQVFPRIRENMLFDGKVKKLRINGLVSKSFEACADPEGRGGGAGGPDPPLKNHRHITIVVRIP